MSSVALALHIVGWSAILVACVFTAWTCWTKSQVSRAIRQTVEELETSRARYAQLFDASPVGMLLLDKQGQLTDVNQAVLDLLGYAREALVGLGLNTLAADHASERVLRRLSIKETSPVRSEALLRCQDGRQVPVEIRVESVELEHGLQRLLSLRDLSERRREERALHRRDTILQAVSYAAERFLRHGRWQEHIDDVLERLGLATEVSRVYIFENHLDQAGKLLTSHRYEWVAPGITPQIDNPDLQNSPAYEQDYRRWSEQLSQGLPIQGHVSEFPPTERGILMAQGIRSLVAVPIFVNAAWWGFMGFDECQTERGWSSAEVEALRTAGNILGAAIQRQLADQQLQESEMRFRGLFESIGDAFVLLDQDLCVTDFSDTPSAIFGLSLASLRGKCFEEAFPRLLFEGADSRVALRDMLQQGDPRRHLQARLRAVTEDAEETFLDLVAYRVSFYGKPHVALLLRDVSQMRKLQTRVQNARHLESLARLASGVAHDFNNLMAVARGECELVMRSLGEEQRITRQVQTVVQAVDLGASLTRQLLSFSRGEKMQPELLHLNLLIRDAAKILAGVIGEDIRLRLELSSTPIYFWGDAALFQRVLLNLASNARDAMPKGGELRIETRLEQLDAEQAQPLGLQPGPFALLRVHDTGHGISPQALRSIFEPFYTTQDSHQRHGLGLSVVHGIVEQHGGHVRVESQLGQGACFTIYLPALDPETTESSDEIAS